MIESVVREAAGKDGFKHLWPKQLGEGCLALSQGTVKEMQLCGEWGLGMMGAVWTC